MSAMYKQLRDIQPWYDLLQYIPYYIWLNVIMIHVWGYNSTMKAFIVTEGIYLYSIHDNSMHITHIILFLNHSKSKYFGI